MLTVRTYYITLKEDKPAGTLGGQIKRLDDLGTVWNDVSLPTHGYPTANISLYDVKTDPNNGDKVFVVGESKFSAGCFGIYVSSNGGNTWQIPGGNYQSIFTILDADHWWRISVVDSNTIYISGTRGHVCKSLDGGLTFTLCTITPMLPLTYGGGLGILDCYSIHFITPLAGVVGLDNNTIMTSDGGVTWSSCCGGNGIENSAPGIPNPGPIFGIHLDITSQIIVANGASYTMRSTNAGVSFISVYTWTSGNGYHLTYEDDLRLWITNDVCGQRARSIDGGVTWTTLTTCTIGAPANPALHFYLVDNGFVSANKTMLSTIDGGLTGILSDTSPLPITAVYTSYINQTCYLLSDCAGVIPPFVVSNDLSAVVGGTVHTCTGIGLPTGGRSSGPNNPDSISLTCGCFVVSLSQSCNNASVVVIDASYTTCDLCNGIGGNCYLLSDCIDPNHTIVTTDNLLQYLDKVVKFEGCPDTCWYVTKSQECPNPTCIPKIVETFETCVDCLPPIIPPAPTQLNLRRIKPGYYTPGCDPEYTETVSCVFSQAVYDKMIIDRYGVTMCCNENVDKWDIKKQLLDLRALFDPALCMSTLNKCCGPCDAVAVILAFDPAQCPAPTNSSANIIIPGLCEAPGSITQIGIIISKPA